MSDILDKLRSPSVGRTQWGHIALHGEAAAEIERLRARVEVLERTLTKTSANLMAAISLLKAGGRDAASSDKMFRQMLNDYEKAAQDGREKLLEAKP